MRRPHHTALARLVVAASATDRELDRALGDVGVLPPLDLTPIRRALSGRDTQVHLVANADGHAIVQVVSNARLTALIHHDGRVQELDTVAA